MKEKIFLPPEEGDLNADAIKKGLSPVEKENLKKDLEAVESGKSSSDTLKDLSDSPSQEFFAQQSYEDDQQRSQEIYENHLEEFNKFVRTKNISEEEISFGDLDWYLRLPESSELDEFAQQINKLYEEWRESK
jgi:hypothetical protein